MEGSVENERRAGTRRGSSAWTRLIVLGSLAVAAFFLVTEHTAHLYGALPYVLVVLFVGLHLLGHGRHGGHAGPGSRGGRS